ncbi:MAG: DUF397 domain-containing protein [Kineosporiaceae bacterium]
MSFGLDPTLSKAGQGPTTTDLAQDSWRTSSFCSSAQCVEVAQHADVVRVRDSKNSSGPVLTYSTAEWRDFVSGVKAGEFDVC